jgi:hypothetical protein
MAITLAQLRPGYNATAAATAAILLAHPWATLLTRSTSEGPYAPLGFTAAALLVGWRLDRTRYTDRDGNRHDWWIPRVVLWTIALGPVLSPPAGHALLALFTGAHS